MALSLHDDALVTLWAKQEIRDVLSRYCRGLDRMDREMAESVFHEDAPANYIGMYAGTGRGFIEWVWGAHEGMERHSHQITNVLIEVDAADETAVSEAYVTVCLWTKPDEHGTQIEIVARSRYLDRWRSAIAPTSSTCRSDGPSPCTRRTTRAGGTPATRPSPCSAAEPGCGRTGAAS